MRIPTFHTFLNIEIIFLILGHYAYKIENGIKNCFISHFFDTNEDKYIFMLY